MLVWLRGVPFGRLAAIRRRAEKVGVRVYSIAPYYATAPKDAGLLLGFSALSDAAIAEGIRRLAPILRG